MFTDAELDQTLIVEIMVYIILGPPSLISPAAGPCSCSAQLQEHQQLPPRKAAETFFADMADLDGAVTSTVDIIDDQGVWLQI